MITPELQKGFNVAAQYDTKLNPHFPFNDPAYQAEIKKVEDYDRAFAQNDQEFLKAAERAALGGKDGYAMGLKVESPWGDNTVLDNRHEDGQDITIKEITVKPGFMLSLQRHRGREELWEVKSGTLTVIADGERIEVPAGESIKLRKGVVHCMNNAHAEPVTVIETQTGINREADNVRLLDFNNRPVYPLRDENEFKSAQLYAELHREIEQKFGCKNSPHPALLVA